MLKDYCMNTSEKRISQVLECFKIARDGEAEAYNPDKLDNKKLLWHGSSYSNFVGILSTGMRLPQWAGLFGKGIYFADLSSKSVCYAAPEGGVGLFVVGELALGNCNKVSSPTSNEYLPSGTHSTHALGRIHPDPKDNYLVDGNVTVPNGKPV